MKAITGGGGGKDCTYDHGLYVQKVESRSVPKRKNSLEEMINQQSAARARQLRSNTNLFVSYVPTRPLALDRQTTTATESGTTATTKHAIHTQPTCHQRVFSGQKNTKQCDTGTNACHNWFLPWILSTYYHLRVAQLNNRRNLYNTTLEAPGTQPLAMLLCGFFLRSNRNHYYLLLV